MNSSPSDPQISSHSHSTTLVFAGGGTGGHLFPGIAVAQAWREQHPNAKILFVGSNRPLEASILNEAGFESIPLPFEPLSKLHRQPLKYLRNWRSSLTTARSLLTRTRPAAVIGLGGFASYPILSQAVRLKLRYLLLEQNVIPGRATLLFSKRASCLCVSYEETLNKHQHLKTSAWTGNPLRKSVLNLARPAMPANQLPRLLICGGSQGSQFLNQAILTVLTKQPSSLQSWVVRHQTGNISTSLNLSLNQAYRDAGISAQIDPFFQSPQQLYTDAAAIICRAGGTTLAEVSYLGLPAIVIPISNSARNHQLENAKTHLKYHKGLMLEESQDTAMQLDTALQQLRELVSNEPSSHLKTTASLPEQVDHSHATQHVVAKINVVITGQTIK